MIWHIDLLLNHRELPLPENSDNRINAIIGLGNPGDQYKATRHNIGFLFLDHLAELHHQNWKLEKRFDSLITSIEFADHKLLLLKPQTYMNKSGQSVSKLMRYQRWQASSLIVAHDEINLPLGSLKLSDKGSAGGHNGIDDIFRLGARDILRFRLGIGAKRHKEMELTDHVLGKFTGEEIALLQSRMEAWTQSLEMILEKGTVHAMNFINRKENRK